MFSLFKRNLHSACACNQLVAQIFENLLDTVTLYVIESIKQVQRENVLNESAFCIFDTAVVALLG